MSGSPTGPQILIGMLVVLVGSIGGAASVELARRSRNWLYLVCALGCIALVCGVVGQRTPQLDTAGNRLVQGPWDAGISIPVLNLQATPVALGGVLAALVGVALVLFFEPVPDPQEERREAVPRRLEEDDAV